MNLIWIFEVGTVFFNKKINPQESTGHTDIGSGPTARGEEGSCARLKLSWAAACLLQLGRERLDGLGLMIGLVCLLAAGKRKGRPSCARGKVLRRAISWVWHGYDRGGQAVMLCRARVALA